MRPVALLLVVGPLVSLAAHAQKPFIPESVVLVPLAALAQQQEGFGLAQVVNLVKMGVDEPSVIAAIRGADKVSFDTSVNGIIAMKSAGLSDKVIAAIIERAGNGGAITPIARHGVDSVVVQEGRTQPIYSTGVITRFAQDKGSAMDSLADAGTSAGAYAGGMAAAGAGVAPLAGVMIGVGALSQLRTRTLKGYSYELLSGTVSTNVIAADQPAEFTIPIASFQDGRYAAAEVALVKISTSKESQARVVGSAEAELKYKASGPIGDPKLKRPISRNAVTAEISKVNGNVAIKTTHLAQGEYAIVFILDGAALPAAVDFSVR
jgi:hypothetical protein